MSSFNYDHRVGIFSCCSNCCIPISRLPHPQEQNNNLGEAIEYKITCSIRTTVPPFAKQHHHLFSPQSTRTFINPHNSLYLSTTMKLTTNAGTTSPSSLSPLVPPLTSSEPRTPPTVNTATVNLIKEFESFVPSPSPDPIGLPTVGYGHRCRQPNGADVPYPFPLTKATATNLLNSDLQQFAKCVFESINDSVTLNDNQ
jgi:hypothetical protein